MVFAPTYRVVLTLIIVPALSSNYWGALLESLDGSTLKAILIVLLVMACGVTDLTALSGQPEGDHAHDE